MTIFRSKPLYASVACIIVVGCGESSEDRAYKEAAATLNDLERQPPEPIYLNLITQSAPALGWEEISRQGNIAVEQNRARKELLNSMSKDQEIRDSNKRIDQLETDQMMERAMRATEY